MQIEVLLYPEMPVRLPFDYYANLSAAIYNAISTFNASFAQILHDGPAHSQRIKLFSFSPLRSRVMEVHGGGPGAHRSNDSSHFLLFKGHTRFRIASPWPELMNAIGEGFLAQRSLRLGSQIFRIESATLLPPPVFRPRMRWAPWGESSIVTSWSNQGSNRKLYVAPGYDDESTPCAEALLTDNLVHKWKRLSEIRSDLAVLWLDAECREAPKSALSHDDIFIKIEGKVRPRLRHIKKQPVRSWIASVTLEAPVHAQRLAWSCGLGEMNSMGFGLLEEQSDHKLPQRNG